MITIDLQDSRPIYEQIVERYKKLILLGVLETDEQMPSVRQLAMELSTNPNTVQKAFAELERQGYLYSVRGRGNFVRNAAELMPQKREELLRESRDWILEAREFGFDAAELFRQALEEESEQEDQS